MRHNQTGLLLNHLQDSCIKLVSFPELSEAFKHFWILNERLFFYFLKSPMVIKICLIATPISIQLAFSWDVIAGVPLLTILSQTRLELLMFYVRQMKSF